MQPTITRCETLPTQDRFNPVLRAYYADIATRMEQIGFPIPPGTINDALTEFWDNATDFLPPLGCLVLALSEDKAIVGCGMLKRLAPDTGELKRLYVGPPARGLGMGRALVEARIEAARDLGLARVVADTLRPNVEMRALYAKLGFTERTEPIETTTYLTQPHLRPYMHYFVKAL